MSNKKFTKGLAYLDTVPILFFAIASVVMAIYLKSILFFVAAVLCSVAGMLKVIWKMLIVYKDKDIDGFTLAFRIMMPMGFVLGIIALFLPDTAARFSKLFFCLMESPSKWLFVTAICGMLLMFVFAFVFDKRDLRGNYIEEITNTFAQLLFMVGVVWITYVSGFYPASDAAKASVFTNTSDYTVEKTDYGIVFTPQEVKAGFIFYPGGLVECEAYAPLLEKMAEKGVLCVLIRMPDNLAILNMNAATAVKREYPMISDWYIGGHSLGGAMSGLHVSKHADEYKGLMLLGAYVTSDISASNLKVLSVYGTEDKVLNKEKYLENMSNLPKNFLEVVIEGGIHSYFGDYGHQNGDGKASITRNQQMDVVIDNFFHYFDIE